MSRQEENAVVTLMSPKVKDRLIAGLTMRQQHYIDNIRAAAELSRISAGARDATKADIAAFACNDLSLAEVDAAVDAIAAHIDADNHTTWKTDMKRFEKNRASLAATITTTTTQSATSNNSSPDGTAHSTQPSEEPPAVPAQSPIVGTEPSTTNVTKAATNDGDDSNSSRSNSSSSKSDEIPSLTHPSKKPSRHPNHTPEPDSLLVIFLSLTISAVLGALLLRNGEEGLFLALLLFVLTILVPYCLSGRLFKWCIAVYAACILLFVVACMYVLVTGRILA